VAAAASSAVPADDAAPGKAFGPVLDGEKAFGPVLDGENAFGPVLDGEPG
jgi:hypothetical protein